MENMTYDQALENLQQTVEKLEKEDLPLEESFALYREGKKYYELCRKILDDMEGALMEEENLS